VAQGVRRSNVAKRQPQTKAIQLCFGKGISARLFYGILGRNYKVGLRQESPLPVHRHLCFGHGLQKCRLGTR
jgi:hypothetical protein